MQTLRNTRATAAVGLVLIAVAVVAAFKADQLPFLNPARTTYSAAFTDASGLRPGDPVEVAGVAVGEVRSIQIEADQVIVEFAVDEDLRLGASTAAAVKVGSLLGSKYLELVPAGVSRLSAGDTIPAERTQPAYDIVTAFGDLATTEKQLDAATIAKALNAVSSTVAGAPQAVQDATRGLTRLAAAIASRDTELRSLFRHAEGTSRVLDQNSTHVVTLIEAANGLLGELSARKQLVHDLLVNTRSLTRELTGLIRDNQRTLTPALRDLNNVMAMLVRHQSELRHTIRSLDNYVGVFTNVVGNGPWFDAFIPGVPDSVEVTPR